MRKLLQAFKTKRIDRRIQIKTEENKKSQRENKIEEY